MKILHTFNMEDDWYNQIKDTDGSITEIKIREKTKPSQKEFITLYTQLRKEFRKAKDSELRPKIIKGGK